jgi:signal transduction histidine kinase
MILKEAINNSIKHSRCKKISLEANLRNDVLEIIINDDGIGMNEASIAAGNGLKNIRDRAEALGGKVKWKSVQGGGTTLIYIGRIYRRRRLADLRKKTEEQI